MEAASFIDECTVHVRGGDGGDGSVSFRRESHVPRGGPDGGDGGPGGDVVLVADRNVTSLLDLRRSPHRRGGDGGHGAGMHRTGEGGRDTVISVPIGTVVREHDTGAVLADLVRDGQRAVLAEGGRGGRGNAAFVNRHRRLPRFRERGERAQERTLNLELKLIADVGLVGFPSVGKSSLVARLSAARPRIEAWPFTTLSPHLGVMRGGDTADGTPIDVVLADVPGLVEGAADGRGLGTRFLRHIERCLVLLHVLDAAPSEPDRDPLTDLGVLRGELQRHDPALLERPQLVVLNKLDLPDGQAMAELVRARLSAEGEEVIEVSAVTGEGLDALRFRLGAMVAEERAHVGIRTQQPDDQEVLIRLAPTGPDFHVQRGADGAFHVVGRRVERWVQMLPLEDVGAVRYLQGRMRRAGVDRALADAGARSGDDVVIGDAVFAFEPELEDLPEEERAALLAGEEDALEGDTTDDGPVPSPSPPSPSPPSPPSPTVGAPDGEVRR